MLTNSEKYGKNLDGLEPLRMKMEKTQWDSCLKAAKASGLSHIEYTLDNGEFITIWAPKNQDLTIFWEYFHKFKSQ